MSLRPFAIASAVILAFAAASPALACGMEPDLAERAPVQVAQAGPAPAPPATAGKASAPAASPASVAAPANKPGDPQN